MATKADLISELAAAKAVLKECQNKYGWARQQVDALREQLIEARDERDRLYQRNQVLEERLAQVRAIVR